MPTRRPHDVPSWLFSVLDFESGLRPLERELEAAGRSNGNGATDPREAELRSTLNSRLRELYRDLSPWQIVQVARHRERPYTLDYVKWGLSDFVELHGDRAYADDPAIVGGPALLDGRSVMVVGQQKGRNTQESISRNFGMPHPEGYRKAERLMRQAERFGMPVVTFVDTPGANAGLADEERGQAEAIASGIATMLSIRVPTVSVVVGEGGSGGAMAISAADCLLMLEYSIFTVASPEAAAAILWRDAAKAADAAQNMRITARDLKDLGLADEIVPEPVGGAHRDHAGAAKLAADAVTRALRDLEGLSLNDLLERRYRKYRDIAFFRE